MSDQEQGPSDKRQTRATAKAKTPDRWVAAKDPARELRKAQKLKHDQDTSAESDSVTSTSADAETHPKVENPTTTPESEQPSTLQSFRTFLFGPASTPASTPLSTPVTTPVPTPLTTPVGTPARTTSSPSTHVPPIMSSPQDLHVDMHNALMARVNVIQLVIGKHTAGTNVMTKTEAGIYMEDVSTLVKEVITQQQNCFKLFDETPDSTTKISPHDKMMAFHVKLETALTKVRIDITDIVRELTPSTTASKLGVPKLPLPKFSGSHNEWPQFKSTFISVVNNNVSYSSTEKLRLLIEALKDGNAKYTIADLQITEHNWTIGWKRMLTRYDSPRETAHAAIRPLLDFPTLATRSEGGLHRLISTVRTCRTQLQLVDKGAVPEVDILYMHFILGRLDKKSVEEFNQSLTTNDIPAFDTLIKFLEREAKNLGLTEEIKNNTSQQQSTSRRNHKPKQERRIMVTTAGDTTDEQSEAESASSVCSVGSSGRTKKKSKSRKQREQKKERAVHFDAKQSSKDNSQQKNSSHRGSSKGDSNPQSRDHVGDQDPCPLCNNQTHLFSACRKYLGMDCLKRKECVKSKQRCFNCLRMHHIKDCSSKRTCKECGGKHHTTLHEDRSSALTPVLAASRATQNKPDTEEPPPGLLPTALVLVPNKITGKKIEVRSLLDCGAQDSLITERLVKALKLPIKPYSKPFTVAGKKVISANGFTTFTVESRTNGKKFNIHAYILPDITSTLPNHFFEIKEWKYLANLTLADPHFNKPGPIDLLLSAVIYDQVTNGEKIMGKPGTPSAYPTDFGYIVLGSHDEESYHRVCNAVQVSAITPSATIPFNMEKFWAIEELPTKLPMTAMETFCEEHYRKNTIRLPNGQYQIKWPFIDTPSLLGSSLPMATRRWYSTETKLMKNPSQHKEYIAQLQDYLDAGHMQLIPKTELQKTPHYYIAHHAVIKESSTTTKLRVVFDGSAKTTSGKSLNNILAVGPTVQPDLADQLLYSRLRPILMLADVKQMYRFIPTDPQEWNYARILWRKDPKDPLLHYWIQCVPFGFAAPPFIATRTLRKLADDEEHKFPLAAQAVRLNFYVDDFMGSYKDLAAATKVKDELLQMMNTAGFELRKWSSNSPQLLASLPKHLRESQEPMAIDDSTTVKTLGLIWHPTSDTFTFKVNLDVHRPHTKRSILSDISKVYDPLGLVSPVVVKAKILMQKIWMRNIEWDDPVPTDLLEEWVAYATALVKLENIKIPRSLQYDSKFKWELHGFSDASAQGMSAVIYLRGRYQNKVIINLVGSKTKVAPIKTITIPRLEFQAAVLLARYMHHIRQLWDIQFSAIRYWTDSTVALGWIYSELHRWKIFIANRVTQIHEFSQPNQRGHVPGEENPADCASRGLAPGELQNHPLWWKGPPWLVQPDYELPTFNPSTCRNEYMQEEERKVMTLRTEPEQQSILSQLVKISSWKTVVRIMARIMMTADNKSFKCLTPFLSPTQLLRGETKLARLIQLETYPELTATHKEKKRNKNNALLALNPFKDPSGVFRVGGRLMKSDLPYSAKHPIILPGKHPLVKIMIREVHEKLAHAGKQTIHGYLRLQYWIPNATKSIKSAISNCLICFRYKAQPLTQLMGQLPSARVNNTRPFLHTGVDNAGPLNLRPLSGRKGTFKVWICLFTCMSTRAIHLELVSSMTIEGFLLAFRRFISRRGRPAHMYSDQGTNFVGAHNRMEDLLAQMAAAAHAKNKCLPDIDLDRIHWHFNSPANPHAGGAWEVYVRLVKTHLKKLTDEHTHTWEEFDTILVFIEALINSRPLTPISSDPNDLETLTPAHFLIGTSMIMNPESDVSHLRLNRLDHYQLVIRRNHDLWKRWQAEYITSLQRRSKWQRHEDNLQVGDMVLIINDQAPPLQWTIGRIKEIHPGRDGNVRVTTVETEGTYVKEKGKLKKKSKLFVRPIAKLAKLPIETETPQLPQSEPTMLSTMKADSSKRLNTQEAKTISPWSWMYTLMMIPATAVKGNDATSSNDKASSSIFASWSLLVCFSLILAMTFRKRGTRPYTKSAAIITKWLITTIVLSLIVSTEAIHQPTPNFTDYAPKCKMPWETIQPVPPCTNSASWIHVLKNGSVCTRAEACTNDEFMLSNDSERCIQIPEDMTCKSMEHRNLQPLECQIHQKTFDLQILNQSELQSPLCAIEDYSLRNCAHFIQQHAEVSVILYKGVIYPLSVINMQQDAQKHLLESYTCQGDCSNVNCGAEQCTGDQTFCQNIGCTNEFRALCNCTYDVTNILHKIVTSKGEIYPDCWGTMYLAVKKEDLSLTKHTYKCQSCSIECHHKSLRITTPGIVSKYIRITKNPGHVSIIPKTTDVEVPLSNQMLTTTGKLQIELWFLDYDIPTKREITCQRVPVCDLIDCHFCYERWLNVQCYTHVQVVILIAIALCLIITFLVIRNISRFITNLLRLFTWPVRACWRLRSKKRRQRSRHSIEDAETAIPLVDVESGSHRFPTDDEWIEDSNNRIRRREYLPATKLTLVIMLLTIAAGTQGCSEFSSISASERECHYNTKAMTTCSIRINTRMALSPVNQKTCFRVQDSRNNHLGTIEIETKSVSLNCAKQLLYYVPQATAKCQGSIVCYNLYASSDCHGEKCHQFTLNSSLKAFKDTENNLGWSYCQDLLHPNCWWIATRDCHFIRLSLDNPTNQIYSVINCPEWHYSVQVLVTAHLGEITEQKQLNIHPGVPVSFQNIDFSLISVSAPYTPLLNECILMNGNQAAVAPCNEPGELTLGELGEIQCSTSEDAKTITNNCSGSINLIRSITDTSGVRCVTDLISPGKLMTIRRLPLKIKNCVLLAEQDSITFSTTTTSLLEIQLSTDQLQITKVIHDTTCEAHFISLEGCYSCLSGSTITLEAKTQSGQGLGTLECPDVGFFTPIPLTDKFKQHFIIIKLTKPDILLKCFFKCSSNSVDLTIKGHLYYVKNVDPRDEQLFTAYSPPEHVTSSGFDFDISSLLGFNFSFGFTRGIFIVCIIIFVVFLILTFVKLLFKKLM